MKKSKKIFALIFTTIILLSLAIFFALRNVAETQLDKITQGVFGNASKFVESMDSYSPSISKRKVMMKSRPMMKNKSAMHFIPNTKMQQLPVENRDKYEHRDINPVNRSSEKPVSTFSIDVDTASYSNIRRYLKDGVLPPKDAVRIEELINYFDYGYKVPKNKSTPFAVHTKVTDNPWNKNTKLLHVSIKGYEIKATKRPAANIVFLLDTSGSMNSSDKLPLVKRSVELFVKQLNKRDRVSVVTYAGSSRVALEPTPGNEHAKILDAIDDLNSGGSTAGGEGIKKAYKLAERHYNKKSVNRIILATDGDFNVGIRNSDQLQGFVERKKKEGIYLSILGFGRGNFNDLLMQKLAQVGNGNASYIDGILEAKKVLVDEMTSTVFPIANDVKIQVEFNPSVVSEYRLIGYESRMLKREDFKNDSVDAGDIGAGHKVTALYEISTKGNKGDLIAPLRYQEEKKLKNKTNEFAFIKLRYKKPGASKSKLIKKKVRSSDYSSLRSLDDSRRFSIAVSAFGQILAGSKYTKNYSFDDVLKLAKSSKGDDLNGYRAEFIRLVELAKIAKAM